jgi:regulator of RNase E activity RraA
MAVEVTCAAMRSARLRRRRDLDGRIGLTLGCACGRAAADPVQVRFARPPHWSQSLLLRCAHAYLSGPDWDLRRRRREAPHECGGAMTDHRPGLAEDTRRLLELTTTATLTTQLFKRGFRNTFVQGVRRLTPVQGVMVGEAFTLRMIPAREDLDHPDMFRDRSHPQRRAIEECPPGAVLAIDCRKDFRGGCLGDILIARLLERGVAGVVTDGALRDVPQIEALAIPVYAGGAAAPASFGIHHAVDLDQPIACGDVAVFPGDVLVGDREGVVVIPRHLADEVARDGAEQEQLESWILKEVKAGKGIFGLYPPDDDTRARYQAWRDSLHERQT